MAWKEEDVRRIIANPYYCLRQGGREPIISEELWIEAAMRRIKEDRDGGKSFLQDLIENLKGN